MRTLSNIPVLLILLAAGCGATGDTETESLGTSLVETVNEPAGENCEHGGIVILSGIDDDADGELSDDEVGASSYVCDGGPGTDGGVGSDGSPGAPGVATLVETEAATTCSDAGGLAIRIGADANGDGTLQDEEVTTEETLCNGSSAGSAPVLIAEATLPEGSVCGGGGTALQVGHDLDGDGTLDPEEVESQIVDCFPCPDGYGPDPNDASQCVEVVTVRFQGTIDSVTDPDGLGTAGVSVGQQFDATIALVAPIGAAVDAMASDTQMGLYEFTGVPNSFTATIGGTSFGSLESAEIMAEVNNDFGFTNQDEYRLTSTANDAVGGGVYIDALMLALYDHEGTAFADDAMRPPMAMTHAEQAQFLIVFTDAVPQDSPDGGPALGGTTSVAAGTITSLDVL